jgi:hypothetical protein
MLSSEAFTQCDIGGINGQLYEIRDTTSFDINIEITDDNHTDFSGIQGICGVRLNFEHTRLSDVRIELIAPNDSSVTLVGPALFPGTIQTLIPIGHDLLFLPDSAVVTPAAGTNDTWTNLIPTWGSGPPLYSGSYYPNFGDLETAFEDTPVDGIWTIRVSDDFLNFEGTLFSAEIIFCDSTGITCFLCEADAGSFDQSLELCEGDVLSFDLWEANSSAPQSEYGFVYLLNDGSTTEVIDESYPFENLAAGVYSITALNVSDNDSLSLTNDLQNGTSITELNPDYCFDISDNTTELEVIPMDTLFTNLPFCSGSATFYDGLTINNKDTVIYRPGSGCAAVEAIRFLDATVEARITGDTVVIPCNSASVMIDASTSDLGVDGQISWTRNNLTVPGADTLILNIDFPGVYVLSINDNGCMSEDSILAIFEFEVKEYSFFNEGPITCADTVISIGLEEPSSVFSANWTGPGIVSDSTFVGSIMVDQPGTYTVMGIDTSSCSYTRFIDVDIKNSVESVSISSDTFSCGNDEIIWTLTSDAAFLNVQWRQGPNTGSGTIMTGSGSVMTGSGSIMTSTNLFDTIYFDVLSANGCRLDTFFSIPTDTNFVSVLGFQDTLDCQTSDIVLDPNSNTNNANFEWTLNGSIISNDQIITVAQDGDYQLIASLDNGCVDTADFNISIDTIPPLISFTSDGDINCIKDSSILEIEVTDDAIVEWQFVDADDATSLRQVVYDSGSYSVNITDPNSGCFSEATFDVASSISEPNFTIEKGDVSCQNPMGFFRIISNENITVELIVNGGAPLMTREFEISDSASIMYLVTGENGCTEEGFEFISNTAIAPEINVPSELALDCIDNTAVIRPEIDLSIVEDFFFILATGDTLRTDSLLVDMPTNIEIVAIGINQCVASEIVSISESLFSGDLDLGIQEGLYCDMSELDVDLSIIASHPQIDYLWTVDGSTASIFELDNSVILSGAGTFILQLTDNINNCTIIDSFELSFTEAPIDPISFLKIDESCFGSKDGTLLLDPISGGQGIVATLINGQDVSSFDLDSLASGDFDILISDELGCTRDTFFSINAGGSIFFELGEDRVVFPREELQLNPDVSSDSEVQSSFWIFNGDTIGFGTSISFEPNGEGFLFLQAANADGCEYVDGINITRALALEDLVYIPNIVAPNSNSGNSLLLASFSERIAGVTSFSIFDRWGNKVQSIQNFLPGQNLELWNGRISGGPASSGVYVFYLEVVLENGQTEQTSGDITVIY